MEKHISQAALKPLRHVELDVLKACAIIFMIICHAVIRLGTYHDGYESEFGFWFGDVVLGAYLFVAHAFMFAMGYATNLTRNYKPSDYIKRGIKIFIMAYVLNFFRYTVYVLLGSLVMREVLDLALYSFLCQDILHFAGLALIFTGILKSLRLKEIPILIVGITLSILGGLLAFSITGKEAFNYIVGFMLVTDKTWSCFAFFNWYIFVAFGIWFGSAAEKAKDPRKFYRYVLTISFVILVVYLILTFRFGEFFMSKERWYYATSLPESIGYLSIDLTLLCFARYLPQDNKLIRLFTLMSTNLNKIYIAQWCILGFFESIFVALLGITLTYPAIYVVGIILIPMSILAVQLTNRLTRNKAQRRPVKNEQ